MVMKFLDSESLHMYEFLDHNFLKLFEKVLSIM